MKDKKAIWVDPETHKKLKIESAKTGKSLTELVKEKLNT